MGDGCRVTDTTTEPTHVAYADQDLNKTGQYAMCVTCHYMSYLKTSENGEPASKCEKCDRKYPGCRACGAQGDRCRVCNSDRVSEGSGSGLRCRHCSELIGNCASCRSASSCDSCQHGYFPWFGKCAKNWF